ncbi:MAG: adenylyl-sulfate kinase [Candidatus Magnetoovum sp. WYHC-5]|nr:adenylyl-sulfate kinase [Candidatus Magnetoovum sp. WYHC-5]
MSDKHIYWHKGNITKADRNQMNEHRSCLLWLTGLSAAGKSTVANKVDELLFENGIHAYVLDGDNIRHGLNNNLGFSPQDRKENIRRIGEVAKLFVDAGIIVMAAFISPYREDRDAVREIFTNGEFFEIYLKCPVEICEQRDPKGNYKKARQGVIKNYTGISAPYEEPLHPELIIDTDKYSVDDSVRVILDCLIKNDIIRLR